MHLMIFSTISTGLYKSAKLWMRLPTQIIGILTPNVILILLGINKPPEYIPVVDFIQQHRIAALVVGCMLAFITLLAAIISHEREPHDDANDKATTVTTTSDTGKKPS